MGVSGNFSPEEGGNGERLDLHSLHERYVSYGFDRRCKYHNYLSNFPGMFRKDVIPPEFKATPQYKEYLQSILDYLISFLNRAGMNNDDDDFDEVDWVGRDDFLKILRDELESEWEGLDFFLEDIEVGFEGQWPTWPKSNTQIEKEAGLLEAKVVMLCALLRSTRFETTQRAFWESSKNLFHG